MTSLTSNLRGRMFWKLDSLSYIIVVEKVSTRFEHTLYGYFNGKRMAFSVVEYYARNNWAKQWMKRIMMNFKGFFFFKFDSRAGLEAVLEGGLWLILVSPPIVATSNVVTPNAEKTNDGFQTVGKTKKRKDLMLLDQSVFFGIADIHDRHRSMRLDIDNMSQEYMNKEAQDGFNIHFAEVVSMVILTLASYYTTKSSAAWNMSWSHSLKDIERLDSGSTQYDEISPRGKSDVLLMDTVARINDPQCELLLLRACVGISKLYFDMRTCSPRVFEMAQHAFDAALRSALERIVTASGLGFGDWQCRLSILPFAFGGLGIYSATSGNTFDDALHVFNTKMETDILSNLCEIATPKVMKKLADIYFTHVTQTTKATFSLSSRHMALWQSQMKDHTSDWLRVVLISGLGQTINGSLPLAKTGMVDFVPGRAVINAAHRKQVKYDAKCANIGYGFLPFSFSSLGELEKDAVTLLKWIRKFSVAKDIGARAAIHIFNMISFAIVQFRRTSLTRFPAQSVRSSNAVALDSPYLLVLITGTSQSRQHSFQFITGILKGVSTLNVLAIITWIMRRTLSIPFYNVILLLLVSGGDSGLAPLFQYQQSRSDVRAVRNSLLISVEENDNKLHFERRWSSWDGLCIASLGPHD
ncbi:reverse transcriptase domain-containing protein [Tanacetum coccineum]